MYLIYQSSKIEYKKKGAYREIQRFIVDLLSDKFHVQNLFNLFF